MLAICSMCTHRRAHTDMLLTQLQWSWTHVSLLNTLQQISHCSVNLYKFNIVSLLAEVIQITIGLYSRSVSEPARMSTYNSHIHRPSADRRTSASCRTQTGGGRWGSQRTNWTELTCIKMTQLHDALLVTRASASRSWLAAVCEHRPRRRLHRGNRELRPGTHARTGANVAFCPGSFHGCALIF